MKISTFLVFLLVLLTFSSCDKWNFDVKVFPKCTSPSAILNFSTNQTQTSFTLTSVTGDVDKVEWFYGDGKTGTTTGYTTQYTYGSSGTYQASVQLSNKCGDLVTIKTNVQVVNVTLPVVVTIDPKNVKINTATLGLSINSFGNGTINQAGVCYSTTNTTPTVSNSLFTSVALPVAVGISYSLDVASLLPNSTYYVRAFCQNSVGVAYGTSKSFQTGALPSVTTLTVDNPSSTKATVAIKINDLGNPVLSRYGVMLSSTSPDPGKSGSYSTYYNDTNGNGSSLLGTIASYNVEGLLPNTLYYYRAFATNSIDTYYGQVNSFITPSASTISLNAGLVAYLPLNGNATDLSINNFTTTVWGTTTNLDATDRKGIANGAMNFNGFDNYIAISDNALLRTPSISVSFWSKPNNPSGRLRMSVVGKTAFANSQGEQYNFALNFSSNQAFTYTASIKQNSDCITPSQNWQQMSVGSFSASGWQHMVYTFDNGVGKIYANGVLRSTISSYPGKSIDNCSGGNLRIGAWWKDSPEYYQGSLDEVRIYNRALSLEEIKTLYNL